MRRRPFGTGRGGARQRFQRVVRGARVAVGEDGDAFEHAFGDVELLVAQAALFVGHGALQQAEDLVAGERLQRVHARAREQGSDHLEGRIFRGRADQDDVAGFDVRQKGVLLRLVEAVHLVHEDDGAASGAAGVLGGGHDVLDFADAAQHGAEGHEFGMRAARDQARQRGLAAARRSPENHRAELVAARWPRAAAGPGRAAPAGRRTRRACAGACARPAARRPSGGVCRVRVVAKRLTISSWWLLRPRPRWRAASYNKMLPATAAFSESMPAAASGAAACGMRTAASAERTSSGGRPAPSLPTRSAAGPRQSASHGARLRTHPDDAAYTRTPATRSCASRIGVATPRRMGRRSAAPADARSALGPNGFAVPMPPAEQAAAPVAPKASAVRTSAPTLPGSCTPAISSTSGVPRSRSSSVAARRPHQRRDALRRFGGRNVREQAIARAQHARAVGYPLLQTLQVVRAGFAHQHGGDFRAGAQRGFDRARAFNSRQRVCSVAAQSSTKLLEPLIVAASDDFRRLACGPAARRCAHARSLTKPDPDGKVGLAGGLQPRGTGRLFRAERGSLLGFCRVTRSATAHD